MRLTSNVFHRQINRFEEVHVECADFFFERDREVQLPSVFRHALWFKGVNDLLGLKDEDVAILGVYMAAPHSSHSLNLTLA